MIKHRIDALEDAVYKNSNKKSKTSELNKNQTLLHDMIEVHFNVDELRDLFHRCDMDYDGEIGNKSTKIWRLVRHYSGRERVLSSKCRKLGGDLGWPFL